MAQANEVASESVEAVRFSFMTDEEVRKHSVVKITNPILLDSVERPVPGGLYDPALGSLDEQTPCKSCGQRSFHCPGHCGHIDLVSPVYNPLLFDMLYTLLYRTCFFCLHFRASRGEVEKCVSQLEMIAKGDVVGAKRFAEAIEGESLFSDDSDGSHVSCSKSHNYSSQNHKQQVLTSLQFTEARSVLTKFLKPKLLKCKNCKGTNPKISKPTFGWLHMVKIFHPGTKLGPYGPVKRKGEKGMSGAYSRANIIRGCKLERPDHDEQEDNSSEVENVNEYTLENDTATSNVKNIGKSAPDEHSKQKNSFSGPLLPSEIRDILKLLWENEVELCSFMCNIQPEGLNTSEKMSGYSMFFLDAVLVPPIKFRPAARGADSVMEHAHTVLLGKVLQANLALRNAHVNNSERSKIVSRWMDLQLSINVLFDSKTATGQRDVSTGICQLLEKKEGIFRQKMMGKRVNYACRSVISPDPYLAVNEIGIPPYFALRLTYPERVTPWNVNKLRDAIINGSEIHPGATNYADKVSTVKLPPSKKARISISRKLPSSRGVVTQFGKNFDHEFEGKIVYRHLQDGDIVLVNRQPTLHKPSIMAHVVRVLKGEKTLRMHYANCSTYNADFDGDEMNVHFPQDEVSRAEAYNIVNANNQYIVPTRGDTVRGLIQDHIVSAVLLTMKDTFLTRDVFNQLLFSSGVFTVGPSSSAGNLSQKISVVDSEGVLPPVLPAVWKPKPLWTGKQVITAVLNHITRGCIPCTVENEGKIPYNYFAGESDKKSELSKHEEHNAENMLLIRKNELVHGVIDKAQFGKYGLVHTVQELYGSNCAGILLSALSRLFTNYLQIHGFTCGVDDLIVLPHYDVRRKEELEGEDVGESVHCDFVHFKAGKIGSTELQTEIEKAICSNGQAAVARLDTLMKNKLRDKGSKINQELLRKGLLKPFPKNCISLMTISGAKGSSVNFQQISSSLGQQELEGKRVPRMVSGKTLPCFPPWDYSSRAGGFITDRFLTGLRPQEYYFHCMAGREGLVDTAVKTSRSGYLQRCLVKNLECLKVSYDFTVRDADGSIIQFCYGEDGVDVHQTSFLNKFKALEANQDIICKKFQQQLEFNSYIKDLPKGFREKGEKFISDLVKEEHGSVKRKKRKDFLMLMRQKYLSSLAQAGEPVGVIAAQSVGEPSTQMTLNTFHLAGRGEMNVTLGIPRLQEILMTASNDIKTPIITCPLLEGTSKEDAMALVKKVKKVTVADLIDSIDVHVLPVTVQNNQISRIYKLTVTLKEYEHVSKSDSKETLETYFLRELEDSIETHLILLSKISGIKNFVPQSKGSNETSEDDDNAASKSKEDEDNDNEDERAEDFGSDAQKRKQQATDEMDYEDGDEVMNEAEPSVQKEEEEEEEEEDLSDDDDDDVENGEEGEETAESTVAKVKKRVKARFVRKDSDRSIYSKAKRTQFRVHFLFGNEPHILLAQIAQKAAKKVYFRSTGKIDQCRIIEYDVNERDVLWEDKTKQKPKDADTKPSWALKAAGIDFTSFWDMDDILKINNVYSNNIHVMLKTYGVEAARATIIEEVRNVFKIYGVEIDPRHLTLIADYMTHAGGYRGMSRHGSIAESVSPFIKMSFETASKFIVEASSRGMTDHLETPSARVCLGLPVKVGTGSFDLMQKLDF